MGVAYGDIDVPEGGSFADMLALIGNKTSAKKWTKLSPALPKQITSEGSSTTRTLTMRIKLGKGKEMVDKLSELLGKFRDPDARLLQKSR
jgi:type I restriction enzyme M protein